MRQCESKELSVDEKMAMINFISNMEAKFSSQRYTEEFLEDKFMLDWLIAIEEITEGLSVETERVIRRRFKRRHCDKVNSSEVDELINLYNASKHRNDNLTYYTMAIREEIDRWKGLVKHGGN